MEYCYKTFSGLVPPDLHGSLYRTPAAGLMAACDWASRPGTRKHCQKSETFIESFGVVVAGAAAGDTHIFEDFFPLNLPKMIQITNPVYNGWW